MTATDERYAIERAKWDAHAGTTTEPIVLPAPGTDFVAFAKTDALLPGVTDFLGDLRDKQVIEYGCGMGKLTVLLALSGAQVTAFDLSERSIEVARERARMLGVHNQIDVHGSRRASTCPSTTRASTSRSGRRCSTTSTRWPVRASWPGSSARARGPRSPSRSARTRSSGSARDYVPYPHKHERGADIPLRPEDIDAWMAPFASSQHPGRADLQHDRARVRPQHEDPGAPRVRPAAAQALAGALAVVPLRGADAHSLGQIGGAASIALASASVAAFDRARWRAALARLPQVAMSHQRRRPVREVS